MTKAEAILKLRTIRANQMIASDKVMKSRTLRPSEKAMTAGEYRARVDALDMAIKVLEREI